MSDLQQSLESLKSRSTVQLRVIKEGDELKISPKHIKTVADSTEVTENNQECETQANHNRTDTIVVKDITQSYQFVSALSSYLQKGSSEAYQYQSSNESNLFFESSGTSLQGGNRTHQSSQNSLNEPIIHDKVFCASCKKLARTEIKYQSHESFWKKIMNLCFHQPQDCMAFYCCVTCRNPLLKVKYVVRHSNC